MIEDDGEEMEYDLPAFKDDIPAFKDDIPARNEYPASGQCMMKDGKKICARNYPTADAYQYP